MTKELIINVNPEEVVIALLEDKQLVEINRERTDSGFSVGDIYLGRVRKIMPGLNAAFVDIGHEKNGFVHYLDLGTQFRSMRKFTDSTISRKKGFSFERCKPEPGLPKDGKISDMLSTGSNILVQISKEAISTKGPRLTSEISIAGRNVVLMPFGKKVSISQKIKANDERKRLKKIAEEILPPNYGLIIRTAAKGKTDADVESDIRSLIARWEAITGKLKTAPAAPALLMSEMNRTTAIIRDLLNGEFSGIYVDDQAVFNEVKAYIRNIAPEKEKIVKLYKGNVPIFDNFDITKHIKSQFGRVVSVKKGSYLIIEHTEALHVIDVNSGNRVKKGDDQEAVAMEVNLGAVEAIAHLLRLRDMGGIIVIDFIDLHKSENRQKIHERMKEVMAADRAKHTILPLTKFGLMQITRQRIRPQMDFVTTEACPTCKGTGEIAPTALLDTLIETDIAKLTKDYGYKRLILHVHPFVAAYLSKGLFSIRCRWMWRYKVRLKVIFTLSQGLIGYKFYDKDKKPVNLTPHDLPATERLPEEGE